MFKTVLKGIDVVTFMNQLNKDKDFNPNEPMTQAYLEEVGYELGWDITFTRIVIDNAEDLGLIEFI